MGCQFSIRLICSDYVQNSLFDSYCRTVFSFWMAADTSLGIGDFMPDSCLLPGSFSRISCPVPFSGRRLGFSTNIFDALWSLGLYSSKASKSFLAFPLSGWFCRKNRRRSWIARFPKTGWADFGICIGNSLCSGQDRFWCHLSSILSVGQY